MKELQVSVVTFNNERTVSNCLRSVVNETAAGPAGTTLIDVVDNASTDGTVRCIHSEFPQARVRALERNVGFGTAHNRVLQDTPAEWALLLNPDAELMPGSLARLRRTLAADETLALVGPRLDSPAGVPEVSFGAFPGVLADLRQSRRVRSVACGDPSALERLETELTEPFRPDWISGACLLGRTNLLRQVGLFDERFFLYLEDVDLCVRLRDAGFSVAVEPRARCVHEAGSSQTDSESRKRDFRASRLAYEKKHGTRLGAFLYRGFKT